MMPSELARGTIVFLPWPFSDHKSLKVRPALVVSARLGGSSDFIAVMITTQCREGAAPWHVCIRDDAPDFGDTGLKNTSYIRCDRVYTFEDHMVRSCVGHASRRIMAEVGSRLAQVLGLTGGDSV